MGLTDSSSLASKKSKRPKVAVVEDALKAEADTTRNAVCVVIAPNQLSLIADEGRNSWRPLSCGARINNKTIMAFVRAEGRRRNSRKVPAPAIEPAVMPAEVSPDISTRPPAAVMNAALPPVLTSKNWVNPPELVASRL